MCCCSCKGPALDSLLGDVQREVAHSLTEDPFSGRLLLSPNTKVSYARCWHIAMQASKAEVVIERCVAEAWPAPLPWHLRCFGWATASLFCAIFYIAPISIALTPLLLYFHPPSGVLVAAALTTSLMWPSKPWPGECSAGSARPRGSGTQRVASTTARSLGHVSQQRMGVIRGNNACCIQ